jgi:hypothetical protein
MVMSTGMLSARLFGGQVLPSVDAAGHHGFSTMLPGMISSSTDDRHV